MDIENLDELLTSSCRISGPGELLQAVPYLLGFRPGASLVLVGLHDGRLVVTARLDLIDATAPELVVHTLDAMVNGGSSSVLAAIYDDAAGGVDAPILLDAPGLELAAQRAGCELLDVLLVAGERWWSLLCAEPGCCPDEGQLLPTEPSPFAAAATFGGVVAFPDRAALEAVLDPAPDAERSALRPLIDSANESAAAAVRDGRGMRQERSVKRALFAAARESAAPGWRGPDDATAARFGVALQVIGVRDALWMAVDERRLDGRPLWRDLGRRLPSPYDGTALFLFGWAAWRSGDGTLAGIAGERAVLADPSCSAADMLLALLSHGIDPRRLPTLRSRRSRDATTSRRAAGRAPEVRTLR
jgi:uncharacterized protein DUF4192